MSFIMAFLHCSSCQSPFTTHPHSQDHLSSDISSSPKAKPERRFQDGHILKLESCNLVPINTERNSRMSSVATILLNCHSVNVSIVLHVPCRKPCFKTGLISSAWPFCATWPGCTAAPQLRPGSGCAKASLLDAGTTHRGALERMETNREQNIGKFWERTQMKNFRLCA